MERRLKFILFIILFLAGILRLYHLDSNPPSLNWDEVSHGYNAYSILKTTKDEWGAKLPLIFRTYGDYKLPLYIYLTVPWVAIFGLNAFSVRLISVLSGIGLVYLAYLITKKVTKKETISLLAAFLTALSPWSLFLSRVAVEANLGACLFALGMYFLILWVGNRQPRNLYLVAVAWGFSLHAYNSARILVPVFAVVAGWLAFKRKQTRQLVFFCALLLFFFLPVIFQFFNRSASARFEWVNLIDQGVIYQIGEKRSSLKMPHPIPTLVFNKVTFFSYYVIKNYLASFSLRYLFFSGGSHYQFSFPNHELLYLVTAPFLLLGLIRILKGKSEEKILGLWFFLSFIPSAITKDSPHVLRSIFILPTPMVLTALGLNVLTGFLKEKSRFKGKLVIGVLILAVLVSFSRWWSDYFKIYPQAYSWAWQYGYQEATAFLKENYSKYEKIFFTKRYGEPHEFILFYWPWNPGSYQEDKNKKWDFHANWYWVDKFDKFEFVNDWEVKDVKCLAANNRCLLVASPNNYPEGWSKIKTINFLDGKSAFEILEK